MTKSEIIAAIESKVSGTSYSTWRIGLTHDPTGRKNEWAAEGEDVSRWSEWQADSLSDAQYIEAYFINKGMKGGAGGDLSPYKTVWVYVF
jgi:hypothetical protein